MIINMYKTKIRQQPSLKTKEVVTILSNELGVSQKIILTTIIENKRTKTINPLNKTNINTTFKKKFDDFLCDTVRRKIHEFWFKNEVPSRDTIFAAVKNDPGLQTLDRSTLNTLIRELNFEYTRRGHKFGLIERDDIVLWRTKYIEDIQKYRSQGRTIYYLGDTWVDVGDYTVSVLHIGSVNGFVDDALLTSEFKKISANYEINVDLFFNWLKCVIPLLKKNAVIVMDDAPYHSLKRVEQCPTLHWEKVNIEKWLKQKGEKYDGSVNKVRLIEIVNRVKQSQICMIDNYVKIQNITILRTPPHHSILNPIELAWSSLKSYVKRDSSIPTLPNVKKLINDGINQCSPDNWKSFVQRTMNEEKRFWKVDLTVDYVMEGVDPNE